MFSTSGCSTSGLYSVHSAKSLEPSMLCSSNCSSRQGSHRPTTKSPRGWGSDAASPLPGRGASAVSPCGVADAVAATDYSLAAPLPAATVAAAATCAVTGGAVGAGQHAIGGDISRAAKRAMQLPFLELVTGVSAREQSKATATISVNSAAERKPGIPSRPVRRAGAAADATDEWEGPDLVNIQACRKDWHKQLTLHQHHLKKQSQGRQQPARQDQQQPALQEQLQREQQPSAAGHFWSSVASRTPRSTVVPQHPATVASAAVPKAAAMATSAAVPKVVPSRLASRLAEPSVVSRPASSITEVQNTQKQQLHRRQLEDAGLRSLPQLGGGFGATHDKCVSSLPTPAAVEDGNDTEKRSRHPPNTPPAICGSGSKAKAASAVSGVCTTSVDEYAAQASGAVAVREAAATDVNGQTSEETRQRQLDRQQQQQNESLGMAHAELQSKAHSPSQHQPQPVQLQRLHHSPTRAGKDKHQMPQLPPGCSEGPHTGAAGGSPSVAAAVAAVELAAAMVGAAASTAADTVGPSAEALVSSVSQRLSFLLTTGTNCSLRAPRRQQQQKRHHDAGLYDDQPRVQQRNTALLSEPSISPMQHQQQRQAHEQRMRQQVLQEQLLGQRPVQQSLLQRSVPPFPVTEMQASCMVQQLPACELDQHQQQQQRQRLLQRLQRPVPHISQTGVYATTRSESPRRLQRRLSAPSQQHQVQQQQLVLHEQQQRQVPKERQRTFFGVHLSAEAEAAAANAAGAAAAAAAARPFCGGNIPPPFDAFDVAHQHQQVQQQQATLVAEQSEAYQLQKVQPLRRPCPCADPAASTAADPAVPKQDWCCSPRASREVSFWDPAPCDGPSRTPSSTCAFTPRQQEEAAPGRRSPAGQQAAEASRRALLLRKSSQASLLQICSAASHDQQVQQPHPVQLQARWGTEGAHALPIAAAAAAASGQNKLEGSETSPTDLCSNSTNVTSDVSSARSMQSALTPQLLHPLRRTPFPLQRLGAETEPERGIGAAVIERPPTPVRAERLRRRLERLRDIGQLSRDTYPAAEVASLISGARVEKEGPFPVYVLDKDWTLGCSALDPDWPQKMLQNTKEGIKLHSEINRLLALAKEVDLAHTKERAQ